MSSKGHALSRDALIRTLTAYSGITTEDGAFDGTATLVDSNLIGRNDFISEKTILIMSGDAKDEDKGATAFDNSDGKITLQGTGFSHQIKAGTIFRVLNISSIEIDVANIDTKIGTNVDAAGTTTLFAWLAKLFTQGGQGLVYYGKVTQIDDATHFRVAGLTGFGDAYFADTYRVYVVRDAAGLGAAPQGEMQPCSGYVSATGIFTHTAFTVGLAVNDEVLLVHESVAAIGLRGDAIPAMNAASDGTQSLIALCRAILERLGQTPADPDDPLHTIVGQRDATPAAGVIDGTASIIALLKQAVTQQGLIYFGDVTTFTDTTHFASTDLIGRENGYFNGWYVFVVRDDGGAGAAPQGEYRLTTVYVGATGTFTHNAFSAALAVGDQVMIIHPMLYEILTIRGGAETLESLDDELDAIPDMAKVPDTRTISVIGTEETITALGVTGAVPFYVAGIWLGMENMAAGDVVRWRVFVDWDGASIADQLTDDEVWTFGGVQGQKWTYMPLNFWVTYEIAVKVTQLDGTAKELHCVLDTGQRGT